MSIVIPAPVTAPQIIQVAEQHRRLVFFGTPAFAVPSLRKLHASGWDIAAVITAPDKPVGRKKILTHSPMHTVALELNIPVLTPQKLRDESFRSALAAYHPTACIGVAYGKIIPDEALKIPHLGFINVHPSLLPAYRGPSPIQTAILDGCASTGVSIMKLDALMDHGPILATTSWQIPSGFDATLCEDELSRIGAELLYDTLKEYVAGRITPAEQNHELATTTHKFTREDGRIDWTKSAQAIVNTIRALGPNPGTWTTWNGKTLNISRARISEHSGTTPPGSAQLINEKLLVQCGDGCIEIEQLQLEGSTSQDARTFLNGHPAIIGQQFA